MPAALILDFDGLILDTETPLLDAWERVHAAHNLVFDREGGHRIIGHSGVAYDPWEAFPPEIERASLEAQFDTVKSAIIAQQLILPGVMDLLDQADAAHLPIGIASNSTHHHVDGHLARLGLTDRFRSVTCRDDVEAPKPHPDVYLAACASLHVDPAASIAFEDSEPGHLAAHRAGLKVVVVPNPSTRHSEFPHATLVLESMARFDLATFHPKHS